jgi:pimeloyl-ACP methyl ester carboxylesterase
MKSLAKLLLCASFLVSSLVHSLAYAADDQREDSSQNIRAIDSQKVNVNGIDIAYKVIGDESAPVILMVMGMGASHMLWGDYLPNQLVAAGYQVVLFDNRDVGESTYLDQYGQPTIWWEVVKSNIGLNMNAPYGLTDMAKDTVGLMDALDIERAHVVGASMGGMIAQVLTAQYPDRVTTLTSIMSTPGFADHLPPPGTVGRGLSAQREGESDAETKARLEHMGFYPDSVPRQLMAILKSGDRSAEVKTITAPTLVLHGKDDTLVPVEHGAYTAELIQGSKYIAFGGMGHNLPPAVLPEILRNMLLLMNSHRVAITREMVSVD